MGQESGEQSTPELFFGWGRNPEIVSATVKVRWPDGSELKQEIKRGEDPVHRFSME